MNRFTAKKSNELGLFLQQKKRKKVWPEDLSQKCKLSSHAKETIRCKKYCIRVNKPAELLSYFLTVEDEEKSRNAALKGKAWSEEDAM